MEFAFCMPTKVRMGKGCVASSKAELEALGNRALIVTGAHSARVSGALFDMEAALSDAGYEYEVFDKVKSNPTIDCAYAGAAAARAFGAQVIVAIGGGSPMDAAKAIALLAAEDRPRETLFSGGYQRALPMVFVPTTAGTGSEVTPYSILTNDAAKTKTSLSSPLLFPKLALLDARYLSGLSREQTVHTAVDALSHLLEGYLTRRATPISDALALEGMREWAKEKEKLAAFSLDEAGRERLFYASLLGGMVIAHTGTTAVHSMGYSLTYFKGVDHGRANGLLMGEFLRRIEKGASERLMCAMEALSMESVAALGAYLDALLGQREPLSRAEAERYADMAMETANAKNCVVQLEKNDLADIYLASLGEAEGK